MKTITFLACCTTWLAAGSAWAASQNASCAFGSCAAQIAGAATLTVSCDGKTVYSGAYDLTTDFQTTQIQATGTGGPAITIQGMPEAGKQAASTLTVAGKTLQGSCGFESR